MRSEARHSQNDCLDEHIVNRGELLGIERRLWANDAEFYAEALLPEALLVFAETGVMGRDLAVAAIRQENAEGRHWTEVHFRNVRWLTPATGVIVVTYRVVARWAHETVAITALASSMYVRRRGSWKLAFHQQTTPAPQVPGAA